MVSKVSSMLKVALGIFILICTPIFSTYGDPIVEVRSNDIQSVIEKTKSDILVAEENWRQQFEVRKASHIEKMERLQEIETRLKQNTVYEGILSDYRYVVDLWRRFADHSFDNISGTTIQRSFPSLPHLTDQTRQNLSLEELEFTEASLNELKDMIAMSLQGFERKQEEDALRYNQILLAAGKLRSKQYQRLNNLGYINSSVFSNNNLNDLVRELRIIPVRWTATFYSKILEFRAYLETGVEGYFYILKELSILFVLLGFFALFAWTFHKVVGLFEKLAETISKHYSDLSSHWALTVTSNIISHAIPWITLLFAMWFAIGIISASSFKELARLIPYVDFYIYYRLCLIAFGDLLAALANREIVSLQTSSRKKALQTAKGWGRFTFLSLALLHTVDTVVGKAMIYSLLSNLILCLSALYIFYLSSQWHTEFYQSRGWANLARNLHPELKSWLQRHWRISPFFAISCTIIHAAFYALVGYLERYDTFKKFTAVIFRSKLSKLNDEGHLAEITSLPDSYINQFSDKELINNLIHGRPEFQQASSTIHNWVKGNTNQHTLVLYGSNGAGKSFMMKQLSNLVEGADVHELNLHSKQPNSAYILRLLHEKLGGTAADPVELAKVWQKTVKKKTVVFIDNAHHLFLSQLNGFDGIRTLLTLINSDIDNIFWCLSFHKESWQYLRQVMDEAHGFDTVLELKPWSAEELQIYIKKAHSQSGFKVSFDSLLSVLGKKKSREDRNSIEGKFFKLLWEQTNGNPSRAVRLWLKSLQFDGKQTLRVIRPPMLDVSEFLDYEDEVHFVCMTLLRHEALLRQQISTTTQQSEHTTARVVKFLLEKDIIIEEDKLLRINPDLAGSIIRSLKRRNYVYG